MGPNDGVIVGLPLLAEGLLTTLELSLGAVVVSIFCGHVGLWLRTSPWPAARFVGHVYVSLMRGTPALVQLFVLFYSMPLVGLGGHPMLAAIVAIGMNSGAYVTEILRANLAVVGEGQREAATALGLPPHRTWLRIIMPQTWNAALPALVNEFTILLKTTPLASVVAVTELTYAGQMAIARTFRPTEVLMLVATGYLLLALPVIALARRLERRTRSPGPLMIGA
jgi:polar amino acid transport system permease protein